LSLVSNKNKKVFLSVDSKIKTDEKIDIILSPEFYWVRIFNIPVKTITQAKDVLPTLFEDILENISDLSYQVLKIEDNKFLCFAYSNKKIYETIKNLGVSLSLVDGIYFSQNECKDYKKFRYENKSFLYTQDNLLIMVPNDIIGDSVDISKIIDSIVLSSNKVNIKLYNNVLNIKQIYSIVLILCILSIINIYKLFHYKNEIAKIDEKIVNIKKTSNLPNSLIQTNSILKNNSLKIKREVKSREFLEYILNKEKFKFKKIDLNGGIVTVNISNSDKKRIENYISKKYKIISSKKIGLDTQIRISL